MPSMGGIEASQLIRSLVCPCYQPYIVSLTANVLPADREKCMAAGMNSFVAKPILVDQLKSSLQQAKRIDPTNNTNVAKNEIGITANANATSAAISSSLEPCPCPHRQINH